MESAGKRGSSDAWSEENDDDQVKCHTEATTKRSYECIFCKRGFTNAQALGGHMNIHRKDRVKAKQPTSSAVLSMNPRYAPTIPTYAPSRYHQIVEAQIQTNHHMYFQPPLSSARLPYAPARSRSLSINEELLNANFSLQIDPTKVDENEMTRKGIMKEDEVDLELRLGHDPYRYN
ncbi:hypothetical protein E1A91_A10G126400v1 [Gossypium mustelinum]|uniref:C2H2-type domain-containing protein n=3 Tax=Gossypium TaxID=3633 RepID=A0A2P5YF63_GOSBA|nr:hypothetical protein ES319_A10G122800v1 [Gossypium barbadense]PPS14230.1 hypothetical protein GOBAR_AA06347 [Gossypium barbadense]TYG98656.1 hypothetical protein ES288_A10G134700v1 [Gossypium darwinii]TYJ14557.1 hypothetical protein E1A91_A10G126400v1 [Gossypium mustelinum]